MEQRKLGCLTLSWVQTCLTAAFSCGPLVQKQSVFSHLIVPEECSSPQALHPTQDAAFRSRLSRGASWETWSLEMAKQHFKKNPIILQVGLILYSEESLWHK